MLKRATHVSKSSALFRRCVRTITVAKKTRLSSHMMHKDVAQLLGWHVSQSDQRFCYDEFFFSYPSFLSYGPWYSCQAFKNLVVPSMCICFGFDPLLL